MYTVEISSDRTNGHGIATDYRTSRQPDIPAALAYAQGYVYRYQRYARRAACRVTITADTGERMYQRTITKN
jgi:hypothetical protein